MEIEDAKKRQGALLRKTRQETQKLCKEKRCAAMECLFQPLCINYRYLSMQLKLLAESPLL